MLRQRRRPLLPLDRAGAQPLVPAGGDDRVRVRAARPRHPRLVPRVREQEGRVRDAAGGRARLRAPYVDSSLHAHRRAHRRRRLPRPQRGDPRGRQALLGTRRRGRRRARGLARHDRPAVPAARAGRDLGDPAARRHDHRHDADQSLQGRRRCCGRSGRLRAARRTGRDRRRGHARRRRAGLRGARRSGRRRAEDDRQRPLGHGLHLRLRHGRPHLHRGDRPPPYDGGVAQPRDGRRGDGTPHRAGSR